MNKQEQQLYEGEEFIVARHSIKPKGEDLPSEKYNGISEQGVELARQQSREWLRVLNEAPERSVLILSPTSEQIRTKSSMRAIAQEMKSATSQDEESNIFVITEEDYADHKLTYDEMIGIITSKIKEAPDKKFIISLPLFIKGFALGSGRWMDLEGNLTPYAADLLANNNNNDQACLEDWIASGGHSGNLEGPNPTKVAVEHLDGIKKLGSFAIRYIPNRPLIIGAVGHSWNLDALAVYLVNNGKVDFEGLKKVGRTMINEMEPIILTSDENGVKIKYGERLEALLEE